MKRPPSLLLFSHDVVGSQMAGPGIRYYHLARVLARELPVTLAVPAYSTNDLKLTGVTLATYQPDRWETIAPLLAQASVALLPSDLVARYPQFITQEVDSSGVALVIDGYDPLVAEWLAMDAHRPPQELRQQWQARIQQQALPIYAGDFFICASERQRDWWLGQLETRGRINPATYQADTTLRNLVNVVPYGLPTEPPIATRPIIKGVWEGISPTDKVVLWGGGLWPWLDPLTAIHAIHHIADARPEIKLVFPGTRHPNPNMSGMPTRVDEAKALAQSYGLTDRNVFFGDWVAYTDWPSVLIESDVALTLHADSIEARLAFRSRVLEYIWAEVPTVATIGDATGDLIADYRLGLLVRPNDGEGVAAAIVSLVDEAPALRADAFQHARDALNWERAAAPLLAFCRDPKRAADRLSIEESWLPDPHQVEKLEGEVAYWRDLVTRYEQGRFMRAMSGIAQLKRRFLGSKGP